ncbi:MAG: ureidoglycolate lyase [Herminiimonas sp.]|nr:ureidoglycolate lyase [Herminiimonas sp.]
MQAFPLSSTAFAPFGELVADATAHSIFPVNDGRALRHARLATPKSISAAYLRQEISLYRVACSPWPVEVAYFERHALSSQLFYPLGSAAYLVVVCASDALGAPDPLTAIAFTGGTGCGINYHPGTWHYPLVTLGQQSDFLMLMAESGTEADCEIAWLAQPLLVQS